MKKIDAFFDKITIYRLMLYYLVALLAVAILLALFGLLAFDPLDILFSSLFLVVLCWSINKLLARIFGAPTNPESALITGVILALIITPGHTMPDLLFLVAASVLAMATKYLLAIHERHIFNPAAIAVFITAYCAGSSASWWVGTAIMLPFVAIGGIIVVRRIRRVSMVASFIGTALLSGILVALISGTEPLLFVHKALLSSALVFVGCVMLPEPLTSPTTKGKQIWYSVLVGMLFPPQLHIGTIYSTPELVLLIGNVLTYIMGPRTRTLLRLKQRKQLSRDSQELIFTAERPVTYRPGQYMELTFQHKDTDARGARRFFTIASSPTEPNIHLGIKFYEPGSSFKRALRNLHSSHPIVASQVGGDFTLPNDPDQKIVFIAGGIGITPYRSMLKYMIDTNQQRTVALLYAARTPEDIVFRDIIKKAQSSLDLRVAYATGDTHIDSNFIKEHVKDYPSRLYYISGPHGMVVATEAMLRSIGISDTQIKKDFFSGYA